MVPARRRPLVRPGPAERPAIPVGGGITLRPLADARLRYEHVDQDGLAEPADALTVRLRTGLEAATASGFSLLAEAEATLPILADYDSGTNGRTLFPIVADPINVELNRLQLRYRPREGFAGTLGRQRIEIDDQRFVGSVGWRQNEQTFDAVRLEARPGPFSLDLSYAWSVRTIFGITAQELPPAPPTSRRSAATMSSPAPVSPSARSRPAPSLTWSTRMSSAGGNSPARATACARPLPCRLARRG